MAGRPTDLTDELADKVVLAVRSGAPLEVAAQSQGVPPGTFWGWMRRGEGRDVSNPPSEPFLTFSKRVREAEGLAHMDFIIPIRKRAVNKEDATVAAGYLRMRWSKHYAERTEISGPEGGPIVAEIASVVGKMDDDALDRLLDRLGHPRDPDGGESPEDGET